MDEMKPGWYSNPETGQTNYWDGSNWTSTPIPMQHQETFRDAPAKTSTLAIVALIVTFFVPPVGWFLGFRAKKEIANSSGRESGTGIARASIWLGGIGTIGIILIVTIMAFGVFKSNSDSTSTGTPSSYYDANGLVQGSFSSEEANAAAAGITVAIENPNIGAGTEIQVSVKCSQLADAAFPGGIYGADDGKLYLLFANGCMAGFGKDPNYFKNANHQKK